MQPGDVLRHWVSLGGRCKAWPLAQDHAIREPFLGRRFQPSLLYKGSLLSIFDLSSGLHLLARKV